MADEKSLLPQPGELVTPRKNSACWTPFSLPPNEGWYSDLHKITTWHGTVVFQSLLWLMLRTAQPAGQATGASERSWRCFEPVSVFGFAGAVPARVNVTPLPANTSHRTCFCFGGGIVSLYSVPSVFFSPPHSFSKQNVHQICVWTSPRS